MFFKDLEDIPKIASKCGTAVFVVPDDTVVNIKNAIVLQPEEKNVITIEQVRGVMARLNVKQIVDCFVIIRPAELLNEEAANALLKNLEEPGEKVHFILVTSLPSSLLPTILSRSALFMLKVSEDEGIRADEKKKELAKRLMVAKKDDLVGLADEITKKKDGVRAFALEVVGLAIEMLYKSYFITEKEAFLQKLPKFLKLYENLSKNGHIKLQIVACLC